MIIFPQFVASLMALNFEGFITILDGCSSINLFKLTLNSLNSHKVSHSKNLEKMLEDMIKSIKHPIHVPSGNLLHSFWKWLIYSWFMLIYPFKMVIFHSFLYVYQRVNVPFSHDFHGLQIFQGPQGGGALKGHLAVVQGLSTCAKETYL